MADSIMQNNRECFITGSTTRLHKHHCFSGGRRQASEKWGCWVWLRYDWHNGANYGVHFNHDLDIRLKRQCQEQFERLYGHDKFMQVFGKSWL